MERATVNHQAAGRGVLGRVLISLPGVRAGHDSDGNMINAVTLTATTNVTYDAMDRAVEFEVGSAYTQIVYGPGGGKFALMNGQTLAKAFVPLAAGAVAVYTPSGLAYYRHADWLGSSRLASLPSGTNRVYYDGAYAPYGENYAESGTTDRSFTGQDQDMVSSSSYPLYDFTMREYNATWGRWISPDPAGLAAVDPTNPQTWNRYAYVGGNPMSQTDPLGLFIAVPTGCYAITNSQGIATGVNCPSTFTEVIAGVCQAFGSSYAGCPVPTNINMSGGGMPGNPQTMKKPNCDWIRQQGGANVPGDPQGIVRFRFDANGLLSGISVLYSTSSTAKVGAVTVSITAGTRVGFSWTNGPAPGSFQFGATQPVSVSAGGVSLTLTSISFAGSFDVAGRAHGLPFTSGLIDNKLNGNPSAVLGATDFANWLARNAGIPCEEFLPRLDRSVN